MTTALLIRPDRNEADAVAIRAAGCDVLVEPYLHVAATGNGAQLAEQLVQADDGTWLIITSPRAWDAWRSAVPDLDARLAHASARGLKVAAVGPASAATLPITADLIATDQHGLGLVTELPETGTALLPSSAIARQEVPDGLRAKGWQVHTEAVYDTRVVEVEPASAAQLRDGCLDAVVLRSPSAVNALATFAPDYTGTVLTIGPTTTAAAQAHPWHVLRVTGSLTEFCKEHLA